MAGWSCTAAAGGDASRNPSAATQPSIAFLGVNLFNASPTPLSRRDRADSLYTFAFQWVPLERNTVTIVAWTIYQADHLLECPIRWAIDDKLAGYDWVVSS